MSQGFRYVSAWSLEASRRIFYYFLFYFIYLFTLAHLRCESVVNNRLSFTHSSIRDYNFSTTERKKKKSVDMIQRWPCDTRRATICFYLHINSTMQVRSWHFKLQLEALWMSSSWVLETFLDDLKATPQFLIFILYPVSSHVGMHFSLCCVFLSSLKPLSCRAAAFPHHNPWYLQCVLSCIYPSIQLLCLLISRSYSSISL